MTLASAEDLAALSRLIDSLAHNTARPEDLRKLSSVSHDHPYSLSEEEGLVWAGDRRGSRLVEALLELLHSSEVGPYTLRSLYLLLNPVRALLSDTIHCRSWYAASQGPGFQPMCDHGEL